MKVELRALSSIEPYAGNPRAIPEEAVRELAVVIQHHGWRQPIVVDGDGVILAGHTRYLAAKRLRLRKVPVLVRADLDAAAARAYRIADNATGEATADDEAKLKAELAALCGDDPGSADLGVLGMEADRLDELMGLVEPPPEVDTAGELSEGGAVDSGPGEGVEDGDGEDVDEDGDAGRVVKQRELPAVYDLVIECPDEGTQRAVAELVGGLGLEGVEVDTETIG
ncbi:MAG: ParB N-terminal domain-containing protein [Planctomycetota bacterium]